MESIKQLLKAGKRDRAWERIHAEALLAEDYAGLASLCRARRKVLKAGDAPGEKKEIRVALLGGTTELLEEPLALLLEAVGLRADLLRGGYNTYAQEMMDPESDAAAFRPDVAILAVTPSHVPVRPAAGDSRERVAELVTEVCDHFLGLCASLNRNASCEIVLNNFHPLPTDPFGNLAGKVPWDANAFLRRVNLALGERAPAFVHISDVDALATRYGLDRWIDPRYWYHAKQPVSFECIAPYVRNVSRIVGSLFGITSKVLVLDLDNTLWGGVVGDDGVEGIRIGEGDAVGEAFKAFQEYARSLKERGVLLAVCSKNEEANALAPFTEHPEMVLRRDDFVAFRANWEPKPQNIASIAEELNLGLSSFVFVDDNPAEREIVRQMLPEVKVLELTDDPADYPVLLDRSGLFEVTALSAEDAERTKQYQANAERSRVLTSAGDYREYLLSLEQRAVVRPFEPVHLDRIAQLVNKTNQFNLTTLRLSRSQVEERMDGADTIHLYARLGDRFGDNGLISVFSASRAEDGVFDIDIWLMSCRVLKRDVERLVLDFAVEEARKRGASALRGTYRPTKKNGLVKDHYEKLGFAPDGEEEDGATRWRLALAGYEPRDVPIEVVEDY